MAKLTNIVLDRKKIKCLPDNVCLGRALYIISAFSLVVTPSLSRYIHTYIHSLFVKAGL